jgi:hypothetical protein
MDGLGDPRRVGTGLLVFGLVGVALAGVMAAGLVGGAVAARNLDESLAADQRRLVTTLDGLTVMIDRLAVTTGNAGRTLDASTDVVTHAGDALDRLATISDDLGTSLDVSILGTRPLASAAEQFAGLGVQVRVISADLDALGARLDTNATDVAAIALEIERVETRVAELSQRIAALGRTSEVVSLIVGGIFLGGLLVAWLAVAAAVCAWIGWRLRGSEPSSTPTPAPA